MSEWWTYSLSDFLMFSARTYYRQFELMNRELWPLHLLAFTAGTAIVVRMLRARPAGPQMAFLLLGISWLCVAWAYHLQRYADIHTGAPYFAAGFSIQAGLLGWMALRKQAPPSTGRANRIAILIVLVALVVFPALAPSNGRSWWQAEMFGLAPDPTVAATLGALLFWRAPWPLWIIPLLWCAASSATLMELRAPLPWMLPALAFLGVAAALAPTSGREQVAGTK
ncbi:DUF6064 family protein [Massilia sp. BSC265]|uniref:DUF6064 family protein n=1 Tax=Massilia sp. BSC265 TaxID=1549812 RepID=UPI00068E0996|nr:DUF6064 family protein [Massilia sp. BSC265]